MRKSNGGNMFLQKFLGSKSSSNKGDNKRRGVLKDVSKNGQDEDRDDRDYSYSKHLSMGGTSFTSGFNSMFNKNQNNNPIKNNNNNNNGELVGISEEYDIQTVVSGLTRDSQFVDSKDPPASNSFDGDDNNNKIENIQDISAQWPDDEASCHQHIIIQITDEGQIITKSDNIIHQQPKKKQASRQHQNKCMNMNMTKISSSGSEPIGRRWDSPPTKKESNNVMSYYTSQRGEEICNTNDNHDGYEVVISSSEPDGIKFGVNNDDKPKISVEPSGKKVGTTSPHSNIKKKSRSTSSISIAVLPDDRDVEVVYGEKEMEIREGPVKEEPSPRLRGRSIGRNTPRRSRTNMVPWMTADDNRNNSGTKIKNDIPSFDDAKKRSRSLPRTLRRLTSRYLKSPQGSSKSNKFTTEIPSQPKEIVVEDEIVSSLGSHLDGCESPLSNRTPEFKKHIRNKSMDHRNFSAASPHEVCENFEPRVCVEFSRRESGGYFQTTCYADEKSSILYEDNAGKTNKSLRYSSKLISDMKNRQESRKNEEVDTSTANSIFIRHDTTATQDRPFDASSRDRKLQAKVQVRAITEEASKNLLLGSNIKDESYLFDEEELVIERLCSASSTCKGTENLDNWSGFVKEDPPIESNACTKHDSSIYPVMTDLKYQSALPVTPSPDKELIHELSTSCVSNDTDISSLAKTPAGRKSLIKKYIALRESLKENQIRVPGSISDSVSLNNTSSSMNSVRSIVTDNVEKSSYTRKYDLDGTIGYDDSSRYYHPVNSTQSLCSTSTSRMSQSSMVKEIFPERRATIDIDATKISFSNRGDSVDMVDDYNVGSTKKKICTPSPSLIRHVSPQQALSSYSFLSDDDSSSSSSVHDTYKPVSMTPRPALLLSNYESPHHQFMKMKLGLSPQSVLREFHI
jgi:hypothetical protein